MSGVVCIRCKGWPCVCDYLARLRAGELHPQVVERAMAQLQKKHDAKLDCPCPHCYRARAASWNLRSRSEVAQ